MSRQILRRLFAPLLAVGMLVQVTGGPGPVKAQQSEPPSRPSVIHKVESVNEKLELTVNTSRRVTLEQKIREVQVNNPDILDITPLSPTVINMAAKSPGVTQVVLRGEDDKVFTLNVVVYGDARELTMILKAQFPNAVLKEWGCLAYSGS